MRRRRAAGSGKGLARPLRISVIIPSWNEEKYIGRTLRSLLDQSVPKDDYEIIVVDGRSADKTVRVARRYADKVLSEDKGSIGHARNVGARASRGEILAFIDADSVAPRNWLSVIRRSFLRDRRLAGISGYIYPTEGGRRMRAIYSVSNAMLSASSKAGFTLFVGFNCAYRRKQFFAAGGFNPRLKCTEDIDLGLRMRSHGRCRIVPELKMASSTRRVQQTGIPKLAAQYALSYWCLFTGTEFPIEYGKILDKSDGSGKKGARAAGRPSERAGAVRARWGAVKREIRALAMRYGPRTRAYVRDRIGRLRRMGGRRLSAVRARFGNLFKRLKNG